MRRPSGGYLRSFLIELVAYAALVLCYFFLVLVFLGDWLAELFHQSRWGYAATALGLIVGQGVLLEMLTAFLLRVTTARFR